MGLFRRDKPLHEQLAEAAGLPVDFETASSVPAEVEEPAAGGPFLGGVPNWYEKPIGPDGLTGRPRRWDAVTTAEAPALTGDSVTFVALPDGTLVVDEDEPDESLAPLADAVEATVRPPYRAQGVRQGASRWAVAAVRIAVVEAAGLEGDQAELITTDESSTLTIDGKPVYGSVPSFERAGEAHGSTYVVRAERIDGDLWQVEALSL